MAICGDALNASLLYRDGRCTIEKTKARIGARDHCGQWLLTSCAIELRGHPQSSSAPPVPGADEAQRRGALRTRCYLVRKTTRTIRRQQAGHAHRIPASSERAGTDSNVEVSRAGRTRTTISKRSRMDRRRNQSTTARARTAQRSVHRRGKATLARTRTDRAMRGRGLARMHMKDSDAALAVVQTTL